jgi:phosphoenolpyruvate synthase/pyruvate phosphate dikinase
MLIPRRNRSLLKYFFAVPHSELPAEPSKEREKVVLPSLHRSSLSLNASLVLQRREELEATISHLKSKHFGPHNASRAHKLELIKSKRGTETEQTALKALANLLAQGDSTLAKKGRPDDIVGCSLE